MRTGTGDRDEIMALYILYESLSIDNWAPRLLTKTWQGVFAVVRGN